MIERVNASYNLNYNKLKRIISPKYIINNPEQTAIMTIALMKALEENNIKLKDL